MPRAIRTLTAHVESTTEINGTFSSITSTILRLVRNYSVTIEEYVGGGRHVTLNSTGVWRFLPRSRWRTVARLMDQLNMIHGFQQHRIWSITVR